MKHNLPSKHAIYTLDFLQHHIILKEAIKVLNYESNIKSEACLLLNARYKDEAKQLVPLFDKICRASEGNEGCGHIKQPNLNIQVANK